ncbi:MAG: hypothetical protein IJU60_00675 [Acholeplasmatales bacterium]|nr:hypothetical protein [Acholeplasmatales bacterium]
MKKRTKLFKPLFLLFGFTLSISFLASCGENGHPTGLVTTTPGGTTPGATTTTQTTTTEVKTITEAKFNEVVKNYGFLGQNANITYDFVFTRGEQSLTGYMKAVGNKFELDYGRGSATFLVVRTEGNGIVQDSYSKGLDGSYSKRTGTFGGYYRDFGEFGLAFDRLAFTDFEFNAGTNTYALKEAKSFTYDDENTITFSVLKLQFVNNVLMNIDIIYDIGSTGSPGRAVFTGKNVGTTTITLPTTTDVPVLNMTGSYSSNRANFKEVTGIELPALEKLIVEEYPYRTGDTSYCFDIVDGDNLNYKTYEAFEAFFKTTLGDCDSGYPTGDEATGRDAQWTKNGRWYQTYWDNTNHAIYINTTVKESDDKKMTASYSLAREQFAEVTYYNLPIVFDVEANMTLVNAYVAGRKSYEISLESGTNLNYQTYMTFETFFADNFTADSGYPTGTETTGREGRWTTRNNDTLYTKYTTEGHIVIGVMPVQATTNMTDSYKTGRQQFYNIAGIWLPELENVELLDTSSFDLEKKDARFKIAKDTANYTAIVSALKESLANEPLANNNNHWEEAGFMCFWEWDYEANNRTHKITIWAEQSNTTIEVGYVFRDYFTITLTAGTGGSVELFVAGRTQNNNTAHVCYNTYSELSATATAGYQFAGFYEGNTLLGTDNPLDYAVVKDVTIVAKFEEEASNMTDSYKAVRTAFNELSGILLPKLEGVSTEHEYAEPDETNHVRDEAGVDLIFTTAASVSDAYAEIKALFTEELGNPVESSSSEIALMDQWSIQYYDATIPYRVEAMMYSQVGDTSISLMWRKQPIVIINVRAEGHGKANGVYINSSYEEVPYTKYWEIVDAFHGTLVATPDSGYKFVGWYVDGEEVSKDARFIFSYKNVTFTEITFVGKFAELVMTESYKEAMSKFKTITSFTLPELEGVTVPDYFLTHLDTTQHLEAEIDAKVDETVATAVVDAFTKQIGTKPTVQNGTPKFWCWKIKVTIDNKTYTGDMGVTYDSTEGLMAIHYAVEETAQMTNSYAYTRETFKNATGLELPEIAELEAVIGFGKNYVMMDIVAGTNLKKDTYDDIIAYLDELTGWTGEDDTHDDAYPTKKYTNTTSGIVFQVVWNDESAEGVIYLNTMSTALLSTFDTYSEAKKYFPIFGITLPTISNVSADFSFSEIGLTFDMTKETDFTETEYTTFSRLLTEKFGHGTDVSDEYQKRMIWTVNGSLWDVVWDLTTGIAINCSEAGQQGQTE